MMDWHDDDTCFNVLLVTLFASLHTLVNAHLPVILVKSPQTRRLLGTSICHNVLHGFVLIEPPAPTQLGMLTCCSVCPSFISNFAAGQQDITLLGDKNRHCLQIVDAENTFRAAGGRKEEVQQPQTPSQPPSHPLTSTPIPAKPTFDKLKPGSHSLVSLPLPTAQEGAQQADARARFSAAVLDVNAAAARQAVRDCAVFIVPQVTPTCTDAALPCCSSYLAVVMYLLATAKSDHAWNHGQTSCGRAQSFEYVHCAVFSFTHKL